MGEPSNRFPSNVHIEVDREIAQIRFAETGPLPEGGQGVVAAYVINQGVEASFKPSLFGQRFDQLAELQWAAGVHEPINDEADAIVEIKFSELREAHSALLTAADSTNSSGYETLESAFGRKGLLEPDTPIKLTGLEKAFTIPEGVRVVSPNGMSPYTRKPLNLPPIIEIDRDTEKRDDWVIRLGRYPLATTFRFDMDGISNHDRFAEIDRVSGEEKTRINRISRADELLRRETIENYGAAGLKERLVDWQPCEGWHIQAGNQEYLLAFQPEGGVDHAVARGVAIGVEVLRQLSENGIETISSNALRDLVGYGMKMLDDGQRKRIALDKIRLYAEQVIDMLELIQYANDEELESLIDQQDGTYYLSKMIPALHIEPISDTSSYELGNEAEVIETIDPGELYIPPERIVDDIDIAEPLTNDDLHILGSLLELNGYPELTGETAQAAAVLGLSASSSAARRRQIQLELGVELSRAKAYSRAREILNMSQLTSAIRSRTHGGGRALAQTGRRGIGYGADVRHLFENRTGPLERPVVTAISRKPASEQ